MYATLEQFLKLSKEDQARVTWLDISVASMQDRVKMRMRENPYLDDAEEYEGECVDRGLL